MNITRFIDEETLSVMRQSYPELLPIVHACYNQTKSKIPEGWCKPQFSYAWCWPAVPPNSTHSLPCSEIPFIPMQSFMVPRRCNINGTWENFSVIDFCQVASHPQTQTMFFVGSTIQRCGYIASLISLLIALMIYIVLRLTRTGDGRNGKMAGRNIVHANLFISFILASLFYLIQSCELFLSETPKCNIMYVIHLYIFTCNIFWLVVEGILLHCLVRSVTFSPINWLYHFYLIGWVFPAFVIIPYTILQWLLCGQQQCWNEFRACRRVNWLIWLPKTVWSLGILYNVAVFGIVLWTVVSKLCSSHIDVEMAKTLKTLKATIVLIPLFGIHFTALIFMPSLKTIPEGTFRFYFQYFYDCILTSTQGFFVALLYCFLYPMVWDAIYKAFQKRQRKRNNINYSIATKSVHLPICSTHKNLENDNDITNKAVSAL